MLTSSRRSPSFVISVIFWTVNSQWPATLPRSQASVIICLDVWSKWAESWDGGNITARLVLTFVISRLNYCNAILEGLPQSTMAPFQRVQNAAVMIVKRVGSRYHITEARRNLHWLSIKYRVIYKLCILIHMVHIRCGPSYISELVFATSALPGRSRLRSSGGNRYEISVIHHKIGERAFSYTGPATWNSLSTILTNLTNTQTFKYSLKTYLFKLTYNLWVLHVTAPLVTGWYVLHIVIWV